MPPAILTRLSKSFRQQQKKIACHSDSKRQSEGGETCPICWKNLPKKPQCLPCGHEFCKGCIIDLKEHAKSTSTNPKCPICRGPLEQESFKKLYKRACHHEQIGSTLIGLGGSTTYYTSPSLYYSAGGGNNNNNIADLHFLSNEVIREYSLAAQKLEECLTLLDTTMSTTITTTTTTTANSHNNSCHGNESSSAAATTTTADETKHKQYRVTTLLKLQEVLKYHVLPETQYEKRISLLKEAILLSPKPIPQAHLELGKIFMMMDHHNHTNHNHNNDSEEEEEVDDDDDGNHSFYELAMDQFEIILKLAEQSRLKKSNHKARKLRGKAHFQMALAHQATCQFSQAAKHYDLAHKYKSCLAYHMAARCFSLSANLPKAIYYGKLALDEEQDDPKCETHLLLLSIYEKLFLVEQLEGNLSESKHYKYHHDIEQYCSCLVQAKNLATRTQERAEVFLRMDTLQGLIPWKLASLEEHFPKKAFSSLSDIPHRNNNTNNNNNSNNNIASNTPTNNLQSRRSAGFTEESSPSENSTYEMGEMEDSLYSNSLYSNSFDYANDDDDDYEDDHHHHSDSDCCEEEEEDHDSNSELLFVSDDDETGDNWTTAEDDECSNENDLVTDVESSMDHDDDDDDDASYHDEKDHSDVNTELSSADNLEMKDYDNDSEPETDNGKNCDNVNVNTETTSADNLKMHDPVSEPETDDGHDAEDYDCNDDVNTESSTDNLKMQDPLSEPEIETDDADEDYDDVKKEDESSAADHLEIQDGDDDSCKPETDEIVETKDGDDVEEPRSEMESMDESSSSSAAAESDHDTPDEKNGIDDENKDPLEEGGATGEDDDQKHLSGSSEEDHHQPDEDVCNDLADASSVKIEEETITDTLSN